MRPRSAAAAAGLLTGDRIVAINGTALRDVIDFQFEAGEEQLALDVERGGHRRAMTLERRGADLGLELVAPRPSEIATCANKCVFCFIHQLPRGMRRSLYVKDDDYRLSFLHGNYITLSDLDPSALERIEAQRLSPLYISVHATNPELRHRLLGSPRHSAEILPRMERLARAGIRMHAQIVLCPGWNDGAELERTVHELVPLHPAVATTAIVPVGLTRHRARLPELRSMTPAEAVDLVDTVERWQARFLDECGSRFVFVADEIYLAANRPVPAAAAYEGFPIAEDGIGLVRQFEDDFARLRGRRQRPGQRSTPRTVTVVTGEMFAPTLEMLLASVAIGGIRTNVVAVPNDFFGRRIGVAGLLTGQDMQRRLSSESDLGNEVLVPAVTVREADGVFLDDLTPGELSRELGVPVRVVAPTAAALLRAVSGA